MSSEGRDSFLKAHPEHEDNLCLVENVFPLLGILLINGSFVRLKGGMNVMKVLLESQNILF